MQFVEMPIEFPKWAEHLWENHRYKVVKSGRGAGKSWAFAHALLLQGIEQPLRIVCGRETQQSLVESVHQLLADRIRANNMGSHYLVQKDNIHGINGTKFIFKGLRHDPDAIKSLEGAQRLWLEEANSISKETWKIVKPTFFRRDDSEIWVSYNPRLATEETHKMFWVDEPPTGTWRHHTSWRDNVDFPEGLRIEMEDDKRRDYVSYLHIWEGELTTAIEGAVYGDEMAEALKDGRITKVSIDRTRAVDTFWDLGYGDSTAIWFAQALPGGTFHIIDHLEDHGKTIQHYLLQLQAKGYLYGTDWLPHDGVDAIIHSRLASGDKTRSIEQIMRASGRKVRIAPKLNITSGINAVRSMLPNCRFDEEKCGRGLDCLRMYQWGPASKQGVEKSEPLHDQYSHSADALRTMATSIKTPHIVVPVNDHSHVGGRLGPDAWMS